MNYLILKLFFLAVTIGFVHQPNFYGQNYADKEYYLVDSLNLDELSEHDKILLDSALTIFHNSTLDTAQTKALEILTEHMMHTDWAKYNELLKSVCEEKLTKSSNQKVKNKLLASLAGTISNEGLLLTDKGRFLQALEVHKASLKIRKEIGDKAGLTNSYTNIGLIYHNQENLTKALEYYLKSLKINEEINDENIASSYEKIGTVFYAQQEYDKALEYFQKSLTSATKKDNQFNIGKAYAGLGLVYGGMEEYVVSINNHKKALAIFESIGNKYNTATTLKSIGARYKEIGVEYNDTALYYFKKALSIEKEIGLAKGEVFSYINLSRFYLEENQLDTAHFYGELAFSLSKKMNMIRAFQISAETTSGVYEELGNYKKSLKRHKLYVQIKDSINKSETKTNLLKQEFHFQSEKKEQEIILLNEQAKLKDEHAKVKDLEIQTKNRWIYSLIGGGVFIVLIIILFILRQRAISSKKQAELKQQVLSAQMNPHFLFNSLNSIKRMYVEGNTNKANDYLSDFSLLLRKILNNTSEEYISLKDDIEMLRLYLELEKVRTKNKITYQIDIADNINVNATKIPPLVIQPFVENAIWHGILPAKKEGLITISITRESDNVLLCKIEDTGIGYFTSRKNKQATHESKGIQLTEQRLGIKNAVNIQEPEKGGTLITLKLPTT